MRRATTDMFKIIICLTTCGAVGCSSPEPEIAPTTTIENASMAIGIATVPAPFVVVSSAGAAVELEAPGETGVAPLSIEATGDLPGGINLVAEAEAMEGWYEQQPEGRYFGNLELVTPNGPAFTARGAYLLDGNEIEEIRVFALHPSASRMLRLTYRYPPGEGKERLQQLAEVLGEIEAIAADDQKASDS